MGEDKHMQLPWSVSVLRDTKDYDVSWVTIPEIDLIIFDWAWEWGAEDPEPYIAKARFIVRAVNSHEKLVDACKAVAAYDDSIGLPNAIVDLVRAALKAAEEGE